MSERTSQSSYEKLVAALLVMAMAAAGWGPFVFEALRLPFIERFLLPASLAFAVISLGLLYDAAERLLGAGRGLYAAAILCTLPASGVVATDPGMLPSAALMMVSAVGIWMASRAQGEERPFFLGFTGALLAGGGYAFGFSPSALALIFVAWLAARQGPRTRLWAVVLLLCYAAGAAVSQVLPLSLPVPQTIAPPESMTVWDMLLPLSPWALFVLPALWMTVTRRKRMTGWWQDAAGVTVLVVIATLVGRGMIAKSTAAMAPMIALLGADMIYEEFREEITPLRKRLFTLPGMLTALMLVAAGVLSAVGVPGTPLVTVAYAAMAVILAGGLVWALVQNYPRWSFVLLFFSGVFFGRLLNQREPLFEQPGTVTPVSVALPLLMIMMGAAAAIGLVFYLLLRRGRRKARGEDYLFGDGIFRSFAGAQNGATVDVAEHVPGEFSFVIFGDVTGAESPFSSRRSGYLAFRAFVKQLEASRPAFAVSLGDLASQATPFAYRRMRALLRQIPVPLVVTPGNHDLFAGGRYDPTLFHDLFGADNAAFRIGAVQFVILNNAWGGLDERQFNWLESALDASSAPFTLVFCHKPPFELREEIFYAMEDQNHAARLHAIFRARRVTAVFSGHIHSLLSEERDGVTYVVSGGGGSKLLSAADQHHYLSVAASPTALVVRALPLSGRSDSSPLLELRFIPRS